MNMQKYYKAEMDRLLTITTSIVSVILLAPAALTAFFWYKNKFGQAGVSPGRPGAELLLLAALLPATAYITRAMAPLGYVIDDINLLIDRRIKPITIPLGEIKEVRPARDGILKGSLRLMGTSGYYGYYGLFWKRGVGKYRAYATRLSELVEIKTEKTLFVLSPENPGEFISSLGALLRR